MTVTCKLKKRPEKTAGNAILFKDLQAFICGIIKIDNIFTTRCMLIHGSAIFSSFISVKLAY